MRQGFNTKPGARPINYKNMLLDTLATANKTTEVTIHPITRNQFELPTPPKFSKKNPLKISFHVGKEYIRRFTYQETNQKKSIIKYYFNPLLSEYKGRLISDEINPRSHGEDCLKSAVAKAIEQTLIDNPSDFFLANRGITIIASEVKINETTGAVELLFDSETSQGLADGATTDAVIAKIQTLTPDLPNLTQARVNLEVFLHLEDRDRIASLVGGRNTSRQVRQWSLADFAGKFDWLKDILESPTSAFRNKVGYEENAGLDLTILDVLSLLTLFHEEFNNSDRSPAIAYAAKGRLDTRLNDDKLLEGYKKLTPIVPEILTLHDYIYTSFEQKYDEAFKGKSKLGKRTGIESRKQDEGYVLPLTGNEANYIIASSYIYPLLGAMRALVRYKKNQEAAWRSSPFRFFDMYGATLIKALIEQIEDSGATGNPNLAAKRKTTYDALFNLAQAKLFQPTEEEIENRKK